MTSGLHPQNAPARAVLEPHPPHIHRPGRTDFTPGAARIEQHAEHAAMRPRRSTARLERPAPPRRPPLKRTDFTPKRPIFRWITRKSGLHPREPPQMSGLHPTAKGTSPPRQARNTLIFKAACGPSTGATCARGFLLFLFKNAAWGRTASWGLRPRQLLRPSASAQRFALPARRPPGAAPLASLTP